MAKLSDPVQPATLTFDALRELCKNRKSASVPSLMAAAFGKTAEDEKPKEPAESKPDAPKTPPAAETKTPATAPQQSAAGQPNTPQTVTTTPPPAKPTGLAGFFTPEKLEKMKALLYKGAPYAGAAAAGAGALGAASHFMTSPGYFESPEAFRRRRNLRTLMMMLGGGVAGAGAMYAAPKIQQWLAGGGAAGKTSSVEPIPYSDYTFAFDLARRNGVKVAMLCKMSEAQWQQLPAASQREEYERWAAEVRNAVAARKIASASPAVKQAALQFAELKKKRA